MCGYIRNNKSDDGTVSVVLNRNVFRIYNIKEQVSGICKKCPLFIKYYGTDY